MKNKLLFVVGPTAAGKTALAIKIAKHFGCPIISADSRQFYKDIPIGTAIPSKKEQDGIPHHFIGHLELEETWSAAKFSEEAKRLIAKENFQPFTVVVGGSGFYLHALEYILDDIPDVPQEIREDLNRIFEENGIEALQKELLEKDSVYYAEVDTQNHKRLIRALEVIRQTGQSFSDFRKKQAKKADFEILKVGIEMPREKLYKRINHRVDIMMENGLLEEARAVYPKRNLNSLNTVGYKEIFKHLDGEDSLENAVEEIKKNTRRFAKRQITWFNKVEAVHWVEDYDENELFAWIVDGFKLP